MKKVKKKREIFLERKYQDDTHSTVPKIFYVYNIESFNVCFTDLIKIIMISTQAELEEGENNLLQFLLNTHSDRLYVNYQYPK